MTSKERAKLKSVASKTDTILQMGKNSIGTEFIKQVRDALKARELIKIRVLETCEMLPMEAALTICEEIDCEIVQVIGSRIVLFKKRSKDDKKPSLLDNAAHTVSNVRLSRDNSKAERNGKKNERFKSGYGKKGRNGSSSVRVGQKNGKKSGNIRRGF